MAKKSQRGQSDGQSSESGQSQREGGAPASESLIPDALREAGRRAAELAQSPVARSLLAAGLVTAAAALATNKTVRESAKRSARDAQDAAETAAEVAADTANKVGAAMINAATDAVRRMMELSGMGGGAADASDGKPGQSEPPVEEASQPAPEPATSSSDSKPATPRRKPAATGDSTTTARKPRSKAVSSGGGKAGAKTATGSTAAAKPRPRRKKSDSSNE